MVAFGHGRLRHVTHRPPYSATGHEQPAGAGASARSARPARTACGNADAASRHARGAGGNASMARAGGIARMAGAGGGTCARSTGAGVTCACNSAACATCASCSSGCCGVTRAGTFQLLDTGRATGAASAVCPPGRLHAACRRSIGIRHGLAGGRPFAFLGSADSHGLDAAGARTRGRAAGSAAGPGGPAAPAPASAPAPAATRSTCHTRCAGAARNPSLLAGDSSETD